MDTPIYSNNIAATKDEVLCKRIIHLLSETAVYNLNNKLTYIPHGICIFPQYKEKAYIINGYPENIFKSSVSRVYALLHDCGYKMVKFLLEPVVKDGMESLKPFLITEASDKILLEDAQKFIYDIEKIRHYEQHAMKVDSAVDKATEREYRRVLNKIINKDNPDTQDEWDRCVHWIVKNCNAIESILKERIKYIEEEANQSQKDFFCNTYYNCLEYYYEKIIDDVVETVYRNRHERKNKAFIKSIVEANRSKLVEEAIALLKKSEMVIDPYKVIVQATDLYLN